MKNIVSPSVRLLAYTEPVILDEMLPPAYQSQLREYPLEFAGRACYQSFDRPNPKTADTGDYLRNIIKLGHESVLEHASVTFYVTGVSRSFTHELIRHRHLSFSQLSQRYVDMEKMQAVIPPALRADAPEVLDINLRLVRSLYDWLEAHLRELPVKQRREAARCVLPNMTETRIVVTGNLRAWRDMLKKRLSPAADAEIREVSKMILDQLVDFYPDVFEDINESS
ncbi:FAD-dependent thymidylate synthase [Corynebacterium pyruviciproducens]|uniref:Flavin-dependent thymidylate synthase n=1 Tax=Corynebacterium pyruviciproducens TaxID=598660 RepID=A0AAF0YY73_9CORY|nr:FAD-dependent thymidylate synthase [Corynebacterium pyruviciproducens]WOT03413.1 FAD-dependent thymidylate synthase [Corynebacterium pyruviciproducens]